MPPVRLTPREGPMNQMLRAPSGDVGRFIEGRLRAIEVAAKQRCPADEGILRSSSVIEMRHGAHGPEGTLTFGAGHALFVHEGTKPHFPPLGAVAQWASRHGFPSPWLVAKAISIHGTKSIPFLYDGLVSVLARARRRHP